MSASPISHASVRECLGDYLEGDLGVPERTAVEGHLDDCPTCREELRGLRETIALLQGLPDPEPPAGLADAVMQRIEAESRPNVVRVAFRRAAEPRVAAALAAGLAVVAVVTTQRPFSDATSPLEVAALDAESSLPIPTEARPATRDTEGGPVRSTRRPIAVPTSPSARPPSPVTLASTRRAPRARPLPFRTAPRPAPAFGGVAPIAPLADVGVSSRPSADHLDRQLDLLIRDPAGFFARVPSNARSDHFARLAQHAARRGRAADVASRLIAVPHPVAGSLVPRFLAASLAQSVQSGPSVAK